MSQRSMLSTLFLRHGKVWLLPVLLIAGGLMATGLILSDVRFMISGLIVVFLILPMLVAYLYINYALIPECAYNVLPHELEAREDGILFRIYPKREKDNAVSEESEDHLEDERARVSESAPIERLVEYSRLSPYKVGLDSVTFPASQPSGGFVYVPLSAFEEMEAFEQFVKYIADRMKK